MHETINHIIITTGRRTTQRKTRQEDHITRKGGYLGLPSEEQLEETLDVSLKWNRSLI
jgi:hypothetical protein